MISLGQLKEIKDLREVWPHEALDFTPWLAEEKNLALLADALPYLRFRVEEVQDTSQSPLNGLTFVVTGDLEQFANRKELAAYIEANGGKVTGSVTKKTNFLINNDVHSTSSKNKKAQELGIPILDENAFVERFGKKEE